jgi:hypothetical protein
LTLRNRAPGPSLGIDNLGEPDHIRLSQAALPRPEAVDAGFDRGHAAPSDHGETSYGQAEGDEGYHHRRDSGIGRAVAIAYAREGADVLIAFLSETEEAAEVKKLVEKEESRERFLTELTLDPPDATSNQAGVPLLMRITSFCPASIPPTVQAVETFFISQKLHDPPGRNRTKIWPTGLRPCPDSLVLFLPVQSSQIAEPADGQSIEIVHALIG